MAVLKNRAKMSTSTTGTGTITLGSAESGYQTFADAGVANADVVRYVIEDTGGAFEIGTGTYTATGTTLSRTVSESSNSDAAINLSGSATVFIGATAEDIPALYAENYDGTSTLPSATGTNALSLAPLSTSTGINSVSIGSSADATGNQAFSFGVNSAASGLRGISFGSGSFTNNTDAVAIGPSAMAQSVGGLALGHDATVITGAQAVAIGDSYASGADSFAAAIANNGSTYGATGPNSVAIGSLAVASGTQSLALGKQAGANHTQTVAIGFGSTAQHSQAVSIGNYASSTATNQISLGGTSDTVKISGTYTLPTADGTANQVLQTDGSGALSFATVSGGGGDPDLYRDNASSATTPVASGTNAVAIGDGATASGSDSYAIGNGVTASAARSIAIGEGTNNASQSVLIGFSTGNTVSGSQAVGIGRFVTASGTGSLAIGGSVAATSNYASAIGRNSSNGGSQAVTGAGAMALGGSYASGTDSFAAAIGNNTSTYGATGSNSVAIGHQAKSTGLGSVAIGYGNPLAQGNVSFATQRGQATGGGSIAMGHFNTYGFPTASGLSAIVIGDGNTGSATRSVVLGNDSTSSHTDAIVIGGGASSSAADQITLGHTDQTVRISSSYTLPTSDGSANQVLQTDGSGALSFATVSGGGSPDLFAENYDSFATKPSATGTNGVAIGKNAVAGGGSSLAAGAFASSGGNLSTAVGLYSNVGSSGSYAVALGWGYANGTNSLAAAITNNTSSYGATGANSIAMGYQAKATGADGIAIGYTAQAAGADGVAIGLQAYARAQSALGLLGDAQSTESICIGKGSAVTADGGVQLGRQGYATAVDAVSLGKSRASGASSFAAAISNNGSTYGATGSQSMSIGQFTRATSSGAAAFGGAFANASGSQSLAIGRSVLAQQQASVALGQQSLSAVAGKFAYSSTNFSATGDSQHGMCVLRQSTTNGDPKVMLTDNPAAAVSAINQVILPNNSAYSFSGTIIARESAAAGSDYASWEIKGALLRDANAASTVLGNGIQNKLYATSGASAWAIALTADTTNGGLKIEVTGAASTNIRWVATVNTSEVTYA